MLSDPKELFERDPVAPIRSLYETIRNAVHGEGCYIMIDEVHFVRGWERVVSTVKNEFRANMYLTGSNSNMLSDDLATHVTGRYATIHVMPFSFREFVTRYPIDSENGYTQRLYQYMRWGIYGVSAPLQIDIDYLRQRLYQYMRWGGMPIIDLDDDGTKNRAILRGVYDSILNNDIRPRVELDQVILENITAFMLSNMGNITSANRITVAASVGDKRTTERYLRELVKSFVFYRADRFDMIGLKHMETNAKFYPVDTGLMNAILYQSTALISSTPSGIGCSSRSMVISTLLESGSSFRNVSSSLLGVLSSSSLKAT